MSGSGGYYKYRCKYWLTYNCPNWVWVNNAPCAHCLADGRDAVSLAEQIAGGGILAGRGWSGSLLAQEQVERSLWTRAGPSFLSYIDHAAGRVEPKVWGYGFSVED